MVALLAPEGGNLDTEPLMKLHRHVHRDGARKFAGIAGNKQPRPDALQLEVIDSVTDLRNAHSPSPAPGNFRLNHNGWDSRNCFALITIKPALSAYSKRLVALRVQLGKLLGNAFVHDPELRGGNGELAEPSRQGDVGFFGSDNKFRKFSDVKARHTYSPLSRIRTIAARTLTETVGVFTGVARVCGVPA